MHCTDMRDSALPVMQAGIVAYSKLKCNQYAEFCSTVQDIDLFS